MGDAISLKDLITLVGFIIALIGGSGAFYHVKFKCSENCKNITKLTEKTLPLLATDLKLLIKERVLKSKCDSREELFKMETQRIEEKLSEHAELLKDQKQSTVDLSKTMIDATAMIQQAMADLARKSATG